MRATAAEKAGMPVTPDAAAAPAQADVAATMPGAPGAWPSAPPGYGAPPSAPYGYAPYGRAAPPSMPYGYPPYGQGGPPSMPLAPGQGYPGYPAYPGFVPLPPQPAKRDLTPWLIGGLVAVIVLVVGGMGALLVLGSGGVAVQSGGSSAQVGGPAPTAVASPSPTVPAGQVMVYQDSLKTGAAGWMNDSTHCGGQSDGYHIKDGYICFAPIGAQRDFTVTVSAKMTSEQANYPVGIAFRHAARGSYYGFDIYSDSEWAVFKCTAGVSTCGKLVDFKTSNAILGGLNQTNTLSVQTQGSRFTFFVNGQRLGAITDSTYAAGTIGLSAGDSVEAVFTNITVTAPN